MLGVGCVVCARVGGHHLGMWALANGGEFWASVAYLVLLAWIFASFGLSLLLSRLVLRLLT